MKAVIKIRIPIQTKTRFAEVCGAKRTTISKQIRKLIEKEIS